MAAKKAKKGKETASARYEDFRAEWERKRRHRHQRERGRGKPGDMNYRPPVIGTPRPHKTSAADFLDELLWLGAYVGNDCFIQAYVAVQESGAIKDGKWAKDFHASSSPPGHARDPFQNCISFVAMMIGFADWSERAACAWAVATFDLPGTSFDAAVTHMRRVLQAAINAGQVPLPL